MPADKEEATIVVRRSKNYVLVGDKLYRRAASSGVLLKYVSFQEGRAILDEIRLLRKSRRFKNTSRQSFPHRILLANSFERRRRTCQKMQRLPNVRKTSSCASSQSHLHPTCLAFLLLGAGSSRTSQESKGWFQVHLRSN